MNFILSILLTLAFSKSPLYNTLNISNSASKQILDTSNFNKIIQSFDGGYTWLDASSGLPQEVTINCAIEQENDVYIGTKKDGLFRTRFPKMGLWKKQIVGNPSLNSLAKITTQNISSIYPGILSPYILVLSNGLFQNIDGTEIWKNAIKLNNINYINSFVELSKGNLILGYDKGILKSNDGGLTWKNVFSSCWASELILLNGIILGHVQNGIIRSVDYGESWEYIIIEKESNFNIRSINHCFLINNNSSTWRILSEGINFSISKDGKIWDKLQLNAPSSKPIISLVNSGNNIICSTEDGIYVSNNKGRTWKLAFQNNAMSKNKTYQLQVNKERILAILITSGC